MPKPIKSKPVHYLTLAVAILKSEIEATIKASGHANALPIVINGTTHSAKSLRYAHFAGQLNVADGLYHGEHRFERTSPDEKLPLLDLNQLPGINGDATHVV